MRVPLKQRCLSVHGCGNKRDLRRHLKLHRFRPHRLLGNLPGTPSLVETLYAWIAKSLFPLVHEEDVVLLELAVLLLVPRSPRTEIVEQSKRGCRVPKPLKRPMEQLLGALEIRVAGCDVVETELRKLREKRQVRVQMSPEAIHAFKPWIDETECHHRGDRDRRVVEHGKFIHEIAVGEVALDSPRVTFMWQDFLLDSHLIAKEGELLFLGFEISEALIPENEVESNEPGSDVFGRVHTPETDILPANGFIEIPREKMKDAAMSEVFLRASVSLFHNLSGKGDAALAGFRLDELQKLLASEIARMRSHKVEETGFLLRIAEIAECLRVDGKDFHRAKIFALISWVSRTRRNLAWSCWRANM